MSYIASAGALLPAAVVIFGVFAALRLKFFMLLHPFRCVGVFLRSLSGGERRSALRALALSLAGTLGVGNITGVAVALFCGGAGAVFWLWVSVFFSMMIKFAEVTLSADLKNGSVRGSLGYIIKLRGGKTFCVLFSALMILSCFTVGGAIQSGAVCMSVYDAFGVPAGVTALLFTAVSVGIAAGGGKRITDAVSFIVPFASAVYVFMCAVVIAGNIPEIPSVLRRIFDSAFSAPSFFGGALGVLTSASLRQGFSKGMLSNEAGMGTSPMAHSESEERDPCAVGMFGAFEVFFDTAVLCTLTAFALMLSGAELSSDGTELVLRAFSASLGGAASPLLALCIFSFALATVICWSHYGFRSIEYICSVCRFPAVRAKRCFLFLLAAALISGAYVSQDILFCVTDVLSLGMTLINMCGVIKNADRLEYLSAESGLIRKCGYVISFRRRKRRDA